MKQLIILTITSLFFLVYACIDKPKDENNVSPEEELIKKEKELIDRENKLLEQEKINLKIEQDAIQEEVRERRLLEQKNNIRRIEDNFTIGSDVYVNVNKTFFHSQPDAATRKKSYLVSGDSGTLIDIRNGFGYIEFYNYESGKTTVGWINLTDLEENDPGC